MNNKIILYIILIVFSLSLSGCRENASRTDVPSEDKKAKQMLQGIWRNAETEDVVFKVSGDTIYYPDSLAQPVAFKIVDDSLFLIGDFVTKYKIENQQPHLFVFRNESNETVKLQLVDDAEDVSTSIFKPAKPVTLNQNKRIKNDTVVIVNNNRYHCYTQVNPSTYKVYYKNYNPDGVAVERIYYDNSVYVGIFQGNTKRYSHEFHKQEFAKYLPKQYQKSGILSEIQLEKVDGDGFHYVASICQPDESVSFVLGIDISFNGRANIHILA